MARINGLPTRDDERLVIEVISVRRLVRSIRSQLWLETIRAVTAIVVRGEVVS